MRHRTKSSANDLGVFGLDESDPNSMPETRDLSPAKRGAILRWLQNPLHGEPLPPTPAVQAGAPSVPSEVAAKGGKAAAAARRNIVATSSSFVDARGKGPGMVSPEQS